MIPVILESPFGSPDPNVVQANIEYARRCVRDCLLRGEAPYASHLLYTQRLVLDDQVQEERDLGIRAGFAWRHLARMTVVYVDRGITSGMAAGIRNACSHNVPVVYRELRATAGGQYFGVDVSHRRYMYQVSGEWKYVQEGTYGDCLESRAVVKCHQDTVEFVDSEDSDEV